MLQIQVKRVSSDALLPTRALPGDAGFDLAANEAKLLHKKSVTFVRTGLCLAVPDGWYLQMQTRSSMAAKGLFVVGGVIDSGFRGQVGVLIYNSTGEDSVTYSGQRIAQAVLLPVPQVELVEVAELPQTARGEKGFGSTGR